MRRVEQLITQVRRATENERLPGVTGSADGISDEEFIQYLNDAQERIQSLIIKTHERVFVKEAFIHLVGSQEKYDLPDDVFNWQQVISVEFSHSGDSKDYYPLTRQKMTERRSFEGLPIGYTPFGSQILLDPVPQSGIANGIRLVYNRVLPKLDKRRGIVDTIIAVGQTITALTMDMSAVIEPDASDFDENDYICVVDRDGAITMQAIPIDGVSSGGIITVAPSFSFEVGESIASGDYVMLGKLASSHSSLPDICEKYLLSYASWKIQKRDSTVDSNEAQAELALMEQDIVDSFALISEDVDQVPIINFDNVW